MFFYFKNCLTSASEDFLHLSDASVYICLSASSSSCATERVQYTLQNPLHWRPFPISATINQEIHLFQVTYGELVTWKNLTLLFQKLKYFTVLGISIHNDVNSKTESTGTSLVVQWLRLCAPNAGGVGLIPGLGTRFHMPQLKTSYKLKLRPSAAK